MKLRTLATLVALLAAVSALVFLLDRPKPPAQPDERIGQPIVDGGAVEKSVGLTLSDQGKTVRLKKESDGTWVDSSYYDLPADFKKLASLISDLQNAKIQRLVSKQADVISRLEFKDTKIGLLDSTEKPTWAITIGKAFESGGRFLRYGEEPKAYLANLNLWIDAEAKNWADSSLLTLKPEEVAKVEISFPDAAPFSAQRAKKEDAFGADATHGGERTNSEKINALLVSLGGIRFTDTSDLGAPSFLAAQQHRRTVKLTTFAGKTITVTLGRKPEEKIIKAPVPAADGKTGPTALGKIGDAPEALTAPAAPGGAANVDTVKPVGGPAKVIEPTTETIPAGPVFVTVADSDVGARINTVMKKRAFQIFDYPFTSLPQKREDLLIPMPVPLPQPTPAPSTLPAPPGAAPQSASKP